MSQRLIQRTAGAMVAIAFGFASAVAHADLIAYEGFATPGDYTDATGLETQTGGGQGLLGNWANSQSSGAANALLTSTSSLTYSTLATTDGSATNAASVRADEYTRAIDLSGGGLLQNIGDELWMSVIVNRSAGNSGWGVTIDDGTDASQGVGIGANNSVAGIQGLIQGTGSATFPSYTNGDVVFLVARITNTDNAGQTWPVVDVWVNPAMNADLESIAVGSGDATVTRQYEGLENISNLVIYSHQNNAIVFDEIRVGDTQADVMPVPEPASLALLGIGAVAMLRRRG